MTAYADNAPPLPQTSAVAQTAYITTYNATTNAPSRTPLSQVLAATGTDTALLLKKAEVTLTSAQILALNATPVTVIAAPGAGNAIIIHEVVATKAAGTAYAGIAAGEDLALKYTNASGAITATIEMTGFADSTGATIAYSPGAAAVAVANAAIVAHMLVGEIITGDSDFKLQILYRVVPVPIF